MMKEKTIVCIGIFLILAVLTSCAFYYGSNSDAVMRSNMESTGRVISFGGNEKTPLTTQHEIPVGSFPATLIS